MTERRCMERERKECGARYEYLLPNTAGHRIRMEAVRADQATVPLMESNQEQSDKGSNAASEKDDCDEPESTTWFVYLFTALTAVGGFLFGYDTGVVSGAMLFLKPAFSLSSQWQELIVSITVAAAALFSLIGGYVADRFGRRPVIFLASFVFTAGSVLLGFAHNRIMLVIGRFVVGAGIGLASMAVPMYIAEASPARMRGRLVTTNVIFIIGGQCAAGILDGAFSYIAPDGWRYMLGVAAIPAVIQFIGFCFMPESPRWLIERGKYDTAKRVLLKIHGSKRIAEEEFEIVKQTYQNDEKERREKGGRFIALTMLRTPNLRRALIVGCGLQLFQQLTAINTVMYYSATIIRMAGIKSTQLAIWLASATAGVFFVFSFLGLYLVEKIGRRLLTLGSLFFVTLTLLLLGIGFHVMASTSPPIDPPPLPYPLPGYDHCWRAASCGACVSSPDCGFCFYENASQFDYNGSCLPTSIENSGHSLAGRCNVTLDPKDALTWAHDWCPTSYAWLTMLGLLLYLAAFAPGMGPMPWTMNSEIYPQWTRSTGNAMATATNWICNLLISITFLTLMEAITKQGAYYLYTAIALIGFVFFYLFLPETKGKTLEELESLFAEPWFAGRHSASEGWFSRGIAISTPGLRYGCNKANASAVRA